jgi:hypothetical protein
MTYSTQGEHANHYTTDAVPNSKKNAKCRSNKFVLVFISVVVAFNDMVYIFLL